MLVDDSHHPCKRADLRVRHGVGPRPGQPKVAYLDPPVRIQKQVAALQVPVNDGRLPRVKIKHSSRSLKAPAQRIGEVYPNPRIVQDRVQASSARVFHNNAQLGLTNVCFKNKFNL